MKNIRRIIIVLVLVILISAAFMKTSKDSRIPIDQIYTVSNAGNGRTLVTWYDSKEITAAIIDKEGRIEKSKHLPLEKDGLIYAVEAACLGVQCIC